MYQASRYAFSGFFENAETAITREYGMYDRTGHGAYPPFPTTLLIAGFSTFRARSSHWTTMAVEPLRNTAFSPGWSIWRMLGGAKFFILTSRVKALTPISLLMPGVISASNHLPPRPAKMLMNHA